ncbi:MAG TPA: SDR family NAD(P)-dependent oxidoreductase [Candidatus Angelobacter sp.]|nr:SDR family NAD(P)-dependent oxidoreductase [Candidatus Angelobacter sp.]
MKTSNKIILGGMAAGMLLAGTTAGLAAALAGRYLYNRLQRRRSRWLSYDWSGEDLRGQTVLITGSSRGLGLALAEQFAREGCNLVLCARHERELSRARQRVERLGAEVCAVTCDVSQPKQVDHLISVARRHFGRVDVLVNNAGTISVGPLESHTLDDFHEAMDGMFWGTVHSTLAVVPAMIERGRGHIVNITSIGGRVSMPHVLPYSSAKFATVGFSEGLHAELRRFGVHVLTVVPGLMRTGSHLNAHFKGDHEGEYGWFAVSATNPLLTLSAERAARKIVEATRHNRADLVLGWQAKALTHAHHASPGLVAEALGLVNLVLPRAQRDSRHRKKGHESESPITRSALTALGRRAALRYNQMEEAA